MSKPDKKAIRKAAKALYNHEKTQWWVKWGQAEKADQKEYIDAAELVVKTYLQHAPVTFQYLKPNWYNPDE